MSAFFDLKIDRTQTNSVKWGAIKRQLCEDEANANPLPMWVADMDFRAPPTVIEALNKAVKDGIFGYPYRTDSYDEAVCDWQLKRFNWKVNPSWIVQTPGVVTALSAAIQTLTKPGDGILIQPPVYSHFFSEVVQNGRQVIEAPLTKHASSYSFDAQRFENAITPNTKIFILCNPHNPTGNVWGVSDLRQMGEICIKHGIVIVSDEIHQDLVFNPNKKHTPFGAVDYDFAMHSIVCTAPSKTFNVAGLQCSNLFIANEAIRKEIKQTLARNGNYLINSLGSIACEAAYRGGEDWLQSLLNYISHNQMVFASSFKRALPQVNVYETDSLYLAWLDFNELGMDPIELEKFLLINARVWFERGTKFGKQGSGFMRANLGCPTATVLESVERIISAVRTL